MLRSSALIIDDVPEIRNLLKHMLHKLGFETIVECHSGRKAISLCNKHRYDYILLDIELENENGITLMPELKMLSPEAVIIMCSAHANVDNVRAAISQGARGFIAKPFTVGNIENSLNKAKLN